jgi:hypothetical protein
MKLHMYSAGNEADVQQQSHQQSALYMPRKISRNLQHHVGEEIAKFIAPLAAPVNKGSSAPLLRHQQCHEWWISQFGRDFHYLKPIAVTILAANEDGAARDVRVSCERHSTKNQVPRHIIVAHVCTSSYNSLSHTNTI